MPTKGVDDVQPASSKDNSTIMEQLMSWTGLRSDSSGNSAG